MRGNVFTGFCVSVGVNVSVAYVTRDETFRAEQNV